MTETNIHIVKDLATANLINGHYYITSDGEIFRYSLEDGEIGGIGSLFKKIGQIVVGISPAIVPLIPGIPQNVQQALAAGAQIASGLFNAPSAPGADFAGQGSQLIAGMSQLIQLIGSGQFTGDRIATIREVENLVYAFQRLPIKSKDKPQFQQIEQAVIAKLNELRTTAPGVIPGQITPNGSNLPAVIPTGIPQAAASGIDWTTLAVFGAVGIGLIWVLK
jgi:hypothetical protein